MTRMDEIRERLDKATPGPWEVWDDGDVGTAYPVTTRTRDGRVIELESKHIANSDRFDADLISHAPSDLAWCLGEIERLTARVAWYEPRYHARSMALIKIRGFARQAGFPEIQGLANEALTTAP